MKLEKTSLCHDLTLIEIKNIFPKLCNNKITHQKEKKMVYPEAAQLAK
jgi:hypothetical protein